MLFRSAVVVEEALAADGAVARPVVRHAARDGGDALREGVVRFIPEETVRSRFLCKRDAEVHEIVTETVRVEAGVGEFFACQRGDLAVFRVVLQELRDLLSAEIFADAPWIENDFQAEFMAFFNDFRNVRPPEVEIEFCDGEIDGVA